MKLPPAVESTHRLPQAVLIVERCDPASGAHCVEVEDTGAGIPPEAVLHVFDRFYRVPGAHHARGFGLGLFIVKRFTELLGGDVTVRSQLGRGTCFSVTLPPLSLDEARLRA